MSTVYKLPADYVDFLCYPGLKTNAGSVPLQRYMGINKGNKETAALFQALISSGIRDTDTNESARDVMPWRRMYSSTASQSERPRSTELSVKRRTLRW